MEGTMTAGKNVQRFAVRPSMTRMPIFWWVHRFSHLRFILRELSSVAVALYAVVLIAFAGSLNTGVASYEEFWAILRTPSSIAVHSVAFLFILFHAITWFRLAPRALVVRIGRTKIPDAAILAGNLAAWFVSSLVIAWVFLGH
jgi:fumarate reductase subunit C